MGVCVNLLLLRKAIVLHIKHGLRLPASMQLFDCHPCQTTYFFLQPNKVGKKGRSPNYVLHPIIFDIWQGETGFLEAPLRPVEQLNKDVEFVCISSGMCE
jgi:hypothetical protein